MLNIRLFSSRISGWISGFSLAGFPVSGFENGRISGGIAISRISGYPAKPLSGTSLLKIFSKTMVKVTLQMKCIFLIKRNYNTGINTR